MTLRLPSALTLLLFAIAPCLGQAPQPRADARQERPRPEPLKLPDLPAVPDRVLEIWAQKTGGIEKMDGEIRRIEYEDVFEVEKHSTGKFYYAKPDKGRLDLTGMKFPDGKMGGKYKLADGDTEEWVCNGERIHQIDREAKQYNSFPIPADQRGQNIMNGPLPFLFGMPPDLAKRRYWLFLKKHDKTTAYILAYPKLPADAQNYRWAEIILDKKTYLPIAVKLRNPANTGDTVYTFKDIVQDRIFELRSPFKADLAGLQPANKVENVAAVNPAPMPQPGAGVPRMPSFVGLHGKDVVDMCKKLGVKPKFLRGDTASRPELKYRVYEQSPPPRTPLLGGQEIKVTLYDDPAKAG